MGDLLDSVLDELDALGLTFVVEFYSDDVYAP